MKKLLIASIFFLLPFIAEAQVASLTPNTGPTTGGTVVTLTGTDFVQGMIVYFGTVTYISPTSATAVSPPEAAGTVTVSTPGGTSVKKPTTPKQ